MSDPSHQAPPSPVPMSAGVPLYVQMLLVGAVALAFVQGAFTIIASNFGKVWPAAASAKVPLPPMNF